MRIAMKCWWNPCAPAPATGAARATLRASAQRGLWSAWLRTPASRQRRHHRRLEPSRDGLRIGQFIHDLWWNMVKLGEIWWISTCYFPVKQPNMAMVGFLLPNDLDEWWWIFQSKNLPFRSLRLFRSSHRCAFFITLILVDLAGKAAYGRGCGAVQLQVVVQLPQWIVKSALPEAQS